MDGGSHIRSNSHHAAHHVTLQISSDRNDSFTSSSDENNKKKRTTRAAITGQRWTCLIFICFCVAVLGMTKYPNLISENTQHSSTGGGTIMAKLDDIVTIPLKPQIDTIEGIDHYYMFPPPSTSTSTTSEKGQENDEQGQQSSSSTAQGLLIFLHSCKKSGLDFFHLPEDRIIAYDAIYNHQLAVFAPTSQHRESGCYTAEDLDWLGPVVTEFAQRHQIENLPRMGMAASSGASFLFFVHKSLKLKSMAVYNTPQSFLFDDLNQGAKTFKSRNPTVIPTVFVTMPADINIAKQMEFNYEQLLDTNTVATQLYKITNHPFTSSLCMSRFPEINPSDCDEIFDILSEEYSDLIDKDGFIKEPLNVDQWQSFFTYVDNEFTVDDATYYMSEKAQSGYSWLYELFQQEMRACHAFHSISVEHHSNIIQFLIDHAGIKIK